jgi:hypothetical protein
VRLEFVQPREAKPRNRIHLLFSMLLTGHDLEDAPTHVRRVADMVAKQELDIPKVPIATKIKGIDIEIFATPPSKTTPLQVAMSNCILRDLVVARSGGKSAAKGELRLFFSVGISFDKKVWKWSADAFTYDCFAKFTQSQSEMFDESEADEQIAPPPAVELSAEQAHSLAERPGNESDEPLLRGPDPLMGPLRDMPKPRRGRPKNAYGSPARKSGGGAHAEL